MTDEERAVRVEEQWRTGNRNRYPPQWADADVMIAELDRVKRDRDSERQLGFVRQRERDLAIARAEKAEASLATIQRDYVSHVEEVAAARDARRDALVAEGRVIAKERDAAIVRAEKAEAHHGEHHTKEQQWMARHKDVFEQLRAALAQVKQLKEELRGCLLTGKDGLLHHHDCMGQHGYPCKGWCQETRELLATEPKP